MKGSFSCLSTRMIIVTSIMTRHSPAAGHRLRHLSVYVFRRVCISAWRRNNLVNYETRLIGRRPSSDAPTAVDARGINTCPAASLRQTKVEETKASSSYPRNPEC